MFLYSKNQNVVLTAQKRAEDILTENKEILHNLAKALLEYEILDGDQINKILKGETIDSIAFANEKHKSEPKEPKSKKKPVILDEKIADSKPKAEDNNKKSSNEKLKND